MHMDTYTLDNYLGDFEKIKRLMLGFSAFQTLVCGFKLKLFQTLADSPGCTRDEAAHALGISRHSARVLLLACCTYELTTRREGRYYNTSMSSQFLTDKSVFPIETFTKYCDVVQYRAFQFLGESLQNESNVGLQTVPGSGASLYKRLAQSPELESCFQDAMAPRDRSARTLLFDAPEFKEVDHLLDVGGGPGLVAALLMKDHSDLKVTLFDLPSVCDSAAAHCKAQGLERFTPNPGDLFADPFPTHCDAILFSHVLEIFSEEEIVTLLRKGFNALPKGGKLFVYGMACDDNESGADMAAWGSLYFMVLARGQGMMYPVADYTRWLKDIGFSAVAERRNDFENMLVIATK
jgi:ubiquinone/menaquinone biosynthesis C-methylase UbiE